MLRRPLVVLALALLATSASAGDPPVADAIDKALALRHLTRKDVGWQARGTWEGYPRDVPYKLRHFDDLLAEPFAAVPWVRAMGASVREYLSPEKLDAKTPQGAGSLLRAVHALGINRKFEDWAPEYGWWLEKRIRTMEGFATPVGVVKRQPQDANSGK